MGTEVMDIEIGVHAIRTFRFSYREGSLIAAPLVLPEGLYNRDERQFVPVWGGGTCVAQCLRWGPPYHPLGEPVPGDACVCGVYGSFSLPALCDAVSPVSYYRFDREFDTKDPPFIAVIAAEGKTIIGSEGLRTARARVVAHWGAAAARTDPYPRFIPLECDQVDALFPGSRRYRNLSEMLAAYNIPEEEL